MKKNVTFMLCSNDMFRYVSKPEFVTLVCFIKVPSGTDTLPWNFKIDV